MARISLFATFATLLATIAHTQATDPKLPVYIPLNYHYGDHHVVSTNLFVPWSNITIEVVYDLGSDAFWLFGRNSTLNWGWGCIARACKGDCNASVPAQAIYDYPLSPTTLGKPQTWGPSPEGFQYAYGLGSKVVHGHTSINDTFVFINDAGRVSVVPNLQVAVVDRIEQQAETNDTATCMHPPAFDKGILGVQPMKPFIGSLTLGPSVRQELLDNGVTNGHIHSYWFDAPPPGALWNDSFTGGALIGGIDKSKFTGPLVKVARLYDREDDSYASGLYHIPPPVVSVNGRRFAPDKESTKCLVDTGKAWDKPPLFGEDVNTFLSTAGLVKPAWEPGRPSPSEAAWNGTCDSIPANMAIDYEFEGVTYTEKAVVRMPLRNYARASADRKAGLCLLSIALEGHGCDLGAPFATAVFFAADDDRNEIALAQGGVSVQGSGPDYGKVVSRIP